jgi:feruloyl esterase
LISWRAHFYTITGPKTSADFIPPQAWKTWIHEEVLKQCDGVDGVKDGIIEDPSLCKFDPQTLKCSKSNNNLNALDAEKCLNPNQIQQLVRIFSAYTYPSGELIFPSMQPGSELQATDKLYAGAPFAYSEDWFKYVVYSDPNWNASRFTVADARAAQRSNPADIRTYPSSLPVFESRGGKLLMYHGQQDNQITCFNTNRFYERLRGTRSYASMHRWVRFFRVSGMFHCSSGPGAWVLGQGGNAAQAGIGFDARYNLLAALVAWVEKGVAPERMEGTKFVNDTVAAGVGFTRVHCMYPARNVYVGGDAKEAGSWMCR